MPAQPKAAAANRWVYSVKFVCGVQKEERCSPVRAGIYATEINIHNFQPQLEAKIEKRIMVLVDQGAPVGREPKTVKAKPFDLIVLPPDSATMDDCCLIAEKLHVAPGGPLMVGFLELVSNTELNVTAVYTATGSNGQNVSIDVETISGRRIV